MPSHLVRVKSTLFVRSRRRVLDALDGEYAARARGRGFDFDDLREYRPGDNVRDIDWKSTARRGEALVRRYLTTRQRVLLLVVDTAATMGAVTPTGAPKRSVAVQAAGILGWLALRHGDRVGLLHGDRAGTDLRPARRGERHLDGLLDVAFRAIGEARARPDLVTLLDEARRRTSRDTIVVVVTDDVELDDALAGAVRHLARARDTLWVSVADANPARMLQDGAVADALTRRALPRHLARQSIADEYDRVAAEARRRLAALLDDAHVSHCRVESEDATVHQVLEMLARRPYGR